MPTVLDFVTDVLQTIGELAQGQTPSPEDGQYCLTRSNGVIGNMSQEEGYIFTRKITSYALTPGVGTYAIGPTAAPPFNGPRPTKIDFARILISVDGTYIGVNNLRLITVEEYDSYSDKSSTSLVPESLYYDNAVPNGNLFLFDIPSASQAKLELTVWQQLQQFSSLADVLVFPDGYYEMLVLVVGVAVSPSYSKQVDPVTAGRAQTCTERIKAINRLILRPGIPMPTAQQNPGQQPAPILPQ